MPYIPFLLLGTLALQVSSPSLPPRRAADAVVARSSRPSIVLFRWENDAVAHTDDNYSNGLSISLSREGSGALGGLWRRFGGHGGRTLSGYEIAQLIMTPRDISRANPDPRDRPYAGLLYAAISTQYVHGRRFQGFKVIAGMVGPASGAGRTQQWFHRLIGDPEPRGWDHQLHNEPIFDVVYEHRRRYPVVDSDGGLDVDVIPVVGGMIGNLLTQAEAEAQLRFGFNLPENFGTTQMRGLGNLPFPRPRAGGDAFGIYGFIGGGGTLVARNISLDGNTFQDSPRVDKKAAVPAAEAGLSIWTRRLEVMLTYVFYGKEYANQVQLSRFGAATLAFRF